MSLKNIFEKGKKFLYKQFSEGGGNMLIWMGALGWFTSVIAQITAINLNKKISKEEKGFLVKQEVADGIVNCGMYLGFTKLVQICVNWGLEKGKITSDTIKPLVEKAAKDKNIDLAKHFSNSNISELLKDKVDDLAKFKKFKNGVDILTNVIASVIACNIVTPLARNYIASKWTNNTKTKKELNKPSVEQNTFATPKLEKNVGFGRKTSLNTYKSHMISSLSI